MGELTAQLHAADPQATIWLCANCGLRGDMPKEHAAEFMQLGAKLKAAEERISISFNFNWS